jgi:DEAD/DEAH box helicase/GRF zinc finger
MKDSCQSQGNSVAIRQNNRLFHREAVASELAKAEINRKRIRTADENKEKNSRGNHDGFEYAIKADGNLLAEEKWRENRNRNNGAYQPPPQPPNSQMIWSLQKIQAELGNSRTRYEQRQKLPPPPVAKPKEVVSLYQPENATSSAPEFCASAPTSTKSFPQPSQSNQNLPLGTEKPPSNHVYNNGASAAVNPYSKNTSTMFPAGPVGSSAPSTAHPFPRKAPPADEFDDGLDDLLANIDEDVLVSQATISKPPPRRVTNDKLPPICIDDDDTGTGFDYGDTSSFDFAGNRNASSSYSNHNFNNNNNNNSHPANSSYNPEAPLCPGHNLPCQVLTAKTAKNAGRPFYKCSMPTQDQQCEFFEWVDAMGGDESYNNNNGKFLSQPSSSSMRPSSTNGNVASYSNESPAFNSSCYGDTTSASTNGRPLCSGHNLPCRLFTSNSENNPGRQFYKCPIAQDSQRCDYFEWADGMAGNFNDFSTREPSGEPGPISNRPVDIHEQNLHWFGHRSFREGQQEVIENAVKGRDVFVLMPTGGGKSLCYQLPACCCPGLSVVISPLLSLIQDQVQNLTKSGVKAVFLNSSQDFETEQREITRQLNATTAENGIKLLYLTPEKIRNSNMIQQILLRLYKRNLLSRFVIDEAHCLSDWGHDFRPGVFSYDSIKICAAFVPFASNQLFLTFSRRLQCPAHPS